VVKEVSTEWRIRRDSRHLSDSACLIRVVIRHRKRVSLFVSDSVSVSIGKKEFQRREFLIVGFLILQLEQEDTT